MKEHYTFTYLHYIFCKNLIFLAKINTIGNGNFTYFYLMISFAICKNLKYYDITISRARFEKLPSKMAKMVCQNCCSIKVRSAIESATALVSIYRHAIGI